MKKRLLAVVLSLAMVLSFLPFSVAAADADYSSGLNDTASYAMKVPEVGSYASGTTHQQNNNSAAMSVREENGEKFWVYDADVFQETQIRSFVRGSRLTYGTVVGVDSSIDMTNVQYLAMRIKINDLNEAGVYQNSRFQVGIGTGTGNAWNEFYRIDKSSTNDSPNLFFSLEDYSMLPVHSDAGTNNHYGIETVGAIDGYLLIPLSHDTTGTLTAEFLQSYYRTITIDFCDYESGGTAAADTLRKKYSNWDNKEFLLGDCFFVEDAEAFAAARTPEGAEKYAVEGGYYALRAGAFRSYQYYANAYEGTYETFMSKAVTDPTAAVTDTTDIYRTYHMTTLSDGSRAVALIPNAGAAREINRYYLYVHDTYETSLNANAGQRNRPDKRIAGSPIDLTNVEALAIRLAVKNPNANSLRIQTIFYGIGTQPSKDTVGQFVDVKTGAVTEYTYDGNAYPITATEFDGYVIIPLDALASGADSFRSNAASSWDRLQYNLLSGYDGVETYLGDVFFVEDTASFLAARVGGEEEEKAVASVGGVDYATIEEAVAAATAGSTVTLLEDTTVADSLVISEDITLDLGGKTISAAADLTNKPVIRVLANVTVTNGTVDGTTGINSYAFIVGNNTTEGTLTIADGTYKGITSVISITYGTAVISGGDFSTAHDGEGTDYGTVYLLNCMDSAYKAGTAKYEITGGNFVGFNPYNNAAEGASTNYLAEGKHATDTDGDGIYTIGDHSYVESVTEATDADTGYTTYTCACGDSYVDNITAPLSGKVSGVAATVDGNKITITWTDLSYVDQYIAYVYDAEGNLVKNAQKTGTKAVFEVADGDYIVKVAAKAGSTWLKAGAADAVAVTVGEEIAAPGASIGSITREDALISWDAVEGAIKYTIKIVGNGETIYRGTTATSIKVYGLVADTEYTVYVNAKTADGYTGYGEGKAFTTAPYADVVLSAEEGVTRITLSWTEGIADKVWVKRVVDGTTTQIKVVEGADSLNVSYVEGDYYIIARVTVDGVARYITSNVVTVLRGINTADELATALAAGGEVELAANVDLTDAVDGTLITEDTVIDLNGKTITNTAEYVAGMNGTQMSALTVDNGATLTIKNGTVDADSDYGIYVKSGNLVIEDGSYSALTSAVQVYNGTVTILGGTFEGSPTYLLNCIDAAYNSGAANIIVKGGTFIGFNPADNAAEIGGANFVADGYTVVEDNGVYTVVPVA